MQFDGTADKMMADLEQKDKMNFVRKVYSILAV